MSCPSCPSLLSTSSSLKSRLDSQLVLYGCPGCNALESLSRLYLCRHCLDLRCYYCVSHEVDSHYCPNCLENVPSGEARSKRNCCNACFECPCCNHVLSTRATTNAERSLDVSNATNASSGTPSSKKVYYLACASCRWSSREAGLAERAVATGAWPDSVQMLRECHGDTATSIETNESRLAQLQAHYRQIAQRERAERENRKYVLGSASSRKLSYLRISERYGLIGRRTSLLGNASFEGEGANNGPLEPAVAKKIEEVDVLPDAIFEEEVDLCSITTLSQRLTNMQLQPEHVSQLVPKHTRLIVRRSQRCRGCEHNLSKPEYNPSSIKFKIQLAGYYHVPRINLAYQKGFTEVKPGSVVDVVIKLTNPSQHKTRVRLLPLAAFEEFREQRWRKEEDDEDNKETADSANNNSIGGSSIASTSAAKRLLMRQTLLVLPRKSDLGIKVNAALVVDNNKALTVGIPNRDDTAEFDEDSGQIKADDDPDFVLYRKYNVVALKLKCLLEKDEESDEKDVVLGFALEFEYTNMLVSVEKQKRETNVVPIMAPVYIKLPMKLQK